MRVLFLAVAGLALAAHAQAVAVPGFELERLTLNPGARDGLLVGGGDLLPDKQFRVSLTGHYEHDPLIYLTADGQRLTVVGGRATAHLAGAFSVTKWLELGLQLPVVAWQGGAKGLDTVNLATPSGFALGTPYVQLRIGFMRQSEGMPIDLALSGVFGFPLGSAAALTRDEGVTAIPRLGVGRSFGNLLRAGLDAGATIRPRAALSPGNDNARDTLGPQIDLGVGVSTLGSGLRGELSVRSAISLTGMPASTELMAGVRYPLGPVELFVVGGPGFGRAPGTPMFRALAGVAFTGGGVSEAPAPLPPPPVVEKCVEGKPYVLAECPALDLDGDGVKNGDDRCATLKGSRAALGCPDADDDGIVDEKDKCPQVKGLEKLKGCPDTDGDGITDAVDQCPKEPGPEDRLGCPATDGDHDGVIDDDDKCPKEPGEVRLFGCPERDTDGDGVMDSEDNCKAQKGPKSNQGCPAANKQLVIITREKLVIKDKVFFDTAKATIQKRSFRLLDQIAAILKEHAEVQHVLIEGHTDNKGRPDANLKLSQARAESVKAYLVKKGVESVRLQAKGYGQERPVSHENTPAGLEQNRRVEFVIVGDEKTDTKTIEVPQ